VTEKKKERRKRGWLIFGFPAIIEQSLKWKCKGYQRNKIGRPGEGPVISHGLTFRKKGEKDEGKYIIREE